MINIPIKCHLLVLNFFDSGQERRRRKGRDEGEERRDKGRGREARGEGEGRRGEAEKGRH